MSSSPLQITTTIPQHLGQVLRENNKTRKRIRHKHFSAVRYNKQTNQQKDLITFYNKLSYYPLGNVINIDETRPCTFQEWLRSRRKRRRAARTIRGTNFPYVFLISGGRSCSSFEFPSSSAINHLARPPPSLSLVFRLFSLFR